MIASVDENNITAAGDNLVPVIGFTFTFTIPVDGITAHRVPDNEIYAIALELYPDNNYFGPWVQTGFLPYNFNRPIILPINHAIIEKITNDSERLNQIAINLNVNIQILAKISYYNDSDFRIYSCMHNYNSSIKLDAVKWYNFLNKWGYPATRLVPLSLNLPDNLTVKNNEANKTWEIARNSLLNAHQNWNTKGILEAGGHLRDAIQYAIFTWYVIWYPEKVEQNELWQEQFGKVLDDIGKGMPTFRSDNFSIGRKKDPDVQKVFSRLLLLRDLNTLANPFHHVGNQLLYTPEDVDVLITNTTSILRGLPSFWTSFPKPLI